jgi:uncharacterized membrane-anchored protein YitT (DUF2179 family)
VDILAFLIMRMAFIKMEICLAMLNLVPFNKVLIIGFIWSRMDLYLLVLIFFLILISKIEEKGSEEE